jgi:hypothetical protein
VVAHGDVDVRCGAHRRDAGVPDETPLHQRGTIAVSRRSRQRRCARRALHRSGALRHVQGAPARFDGAWHGPLPGHRQRRLDAIDPVQDPAPR